MGTSRSRYDGFAREGHGEGRRDEFHWGGDEDGRLLGDARFAQRALNKPVTGKTQITLDAVIRMVCKDHKLTEKALKHAARERVASEACSTVGWLAQRSGQITLTEVATRFGRDVTTLSRRVVQLGLNARDFQALARTLARFTVIATKP